MKTVYSFDPVSGEYLGAIDAPLDPLASKQAGEPVYVSPAYALDVAPPSPGPQQVPVAVNGAWQLKADHRGEQWYGGEDGRQIVFVDRIGYPTTFDPPLLISPAPYTLAELREQKAFVLSKACRDAIVAGYSSAALGAAHHYPSKPTDQANMAASVLDSIVAPSGEWQTPFWCRDGAGEWAFRLHNAEQIQIAGRDGKAHVIAQQFKMETLSAQLAAADTAEAIAAIAW